MSVHRVHGAVATIMKEDPTGGFWSRVIGLGIDEPVTDQVLDDVARIYREAGSERVMLRMSPEARRRSGRACWSVGASPEADPGSSCSATRRPRPNP